MNSTFRTDRRSFLKQLGMAGLTAPFIMRDLIAAPRLETVRHASFGGAGMAASDWGAITSHPNVKLICVAEVDLARAEAVKKKFPDVKIYQD